jgi:hypothetical protein
MNHSIDGADRTTHLKIVIVGLLAGLAIAGLAISSRVSSTEAAVKAGKPVTMSSMVMLTR